MKSAYIYIHAALILGAFIDDMVILMLRYSILCEMWRHPLVCFLHLVKMISRKVWIFLCYI